MNESLMNTNAEDARETPRDNVNEVQPFFGSTLFQRHTTASLSDKRGSEMEIGLMKDENGKLCYCYRYYVTQGNGRQKMH